MNDNTKKAGCILYNKEKNQIALVYRKKYGDLSFPKGHLEAGETLTECALRELEEETSRLSHLASNEPLGTMNYITNEDEKVEVYIYLALDDGKSKKVSPDPEILVWVEFDDVEEALSYDNLIVFWNKVKTKVRKLIQ